MALGRPVLAVSVDGMRELISKEVGWLVEPENVEGLARTIAEAILKPQEREFRGSNGKKLVQAIYPISNMLQLHEEILLKLLNTSGSDNIDVEPILKTESSTFPEC